MKVMFLLPDILPGGAEMLVRNMVCRGFSTEFDVIVCSLGRRRNSFLTQDIERQGVKIHFLGQRALIDLTIFVRLYKLLKKEQPDVVHTHLNSVAYSLLPVSLAGIQCKMHTVHNIAKHEGKFPLRAATLMAFRVFGYIPIGISRIIGGSIKSYYGVKRVPIINNGIPTANYTRNEEFRYRKRKSLGVCEGDFVCIHIGRFVEQKNHDLLIRAFALAQMNEKRLKLLLVGDGYLMNVIYQKVITYGVQERVQFLGIRKDVSALLNASDLFVFSSDWEGLPLTLIEAMSSGLPVISTNVGGISDLVMDGVTGFLSPPGDAKALAARITQLASDPVFAENLGRAGRQWAQEAFDIEKTFLAHEALYGSGPHCH